MAHKRSPGTGEKSADKKRRHTHHAYLIAVKQRREATRVYALLSPSAEDALAVVQSMAAEGTTVELAGKLTKRMARSLKLQPGELHLV